MLWNLCMKLLNSVSPPKTKPLLVGSRASKLALKQVEEVYEGLRFHHPSILFNVRCTPTKGDRDLKTSLKFMESTNFFTQELEQWVLEGQIQVAIHSAKDLAQPLPKGLKIVAITQCLENRDVLVFRSGFFFSKNNQALSVGVSTVRREKEVLSLYPNAKLVDLRGTIDVRLNRLKKGDLDALVMAKVALMRLSYEQYDTQILDCETPPYQGSLAVVAREGDAEMEELFASIDFRRGQKSLYFGLDPSRFLTCGPITHCPLIAIEPLGISKEHLGQFDRCSHLLITSQTTLKILFNLFKKDRLRISLLRQKKVIAIGQATCQYAIKCGLSVDYLSVQESQEGLIELFSQLPSSLLPKIFYPKSSLARPLLLHFLTQRYPEVWNCDLYDTHCICPPSIPNLEEVQELVFTSSSSVNSFFEIYKEVPSHLRLIFKSKICEKKFFEKKSKRNFSILKK